MKKINLAFFIFIIIFIINDLYAEEMLYSVSTGSDKLINITEKDKDETGYTFTSTIKRNDKVICNYQIHTDSSMATVEFVLNDTDNRVNLKAVRAGNMITITGEKADKDVDLNLKIDEHPWFQIFPDVPYGLDRFVAGNEKRIKFWTISPDILKEVLIRADKKSEESLNISGETIKAVKVHITINGIGSIFWGEDYYFRKTDGQFIYVKGALKTKDNKTIVEFAGEK